MFAGVSETRRSAGSSTRLGHGGVGIKVVGLGVRGWIRAVDLIGLFVCVLNWVTVHRGTPYQPNAPELALRGFPRLSTFR